MCQTCEESVTPCLHGDLLPWAPLCINNTPEYYGCAFFQWTISTFGNVVCEVLQEEKKKIAKGYAKDRKSFYMLSRLISYWKWPRLYPNFNHLTASRAANITTVSLLIPFLTSLLLIWSWSCLLHRRKQWGHCLALFFLTFTRHFVSLREEYFSKKAKFFVCWVGFQSFIYG